MSRRSTGIAIAFVTACISGVSIWVNSHAVARFDDATVYTTAKNAVAGLLLLALALPLLRRAGNGAAAVPSRLRPALLAVAVVGGSVPFVLFFEGLARAEATQAAFIQKTLVVWVALLAIPLRRERIGIAHVAAIVFVIAGQAVLAGSAGTVVFGTGEAMILAATLLWAVEVMLAKRLLDDVAVRVLAVARMVLGTVLLLAWLVVSGRADDFVRLPASQWSWALLTGVLLGAYVATWYAALARAQCVDVTAVLVFGAVVTAFLAQAADGVAFDALGVVLVTVGVALAAVAGSRPSLRTA
ncbi:MAG TPA: DMT family transporter [Gaiellaceae bacterium]|nr:DMT family transporter [Gaiellaceae bacterium]